MKTTIEPTLSPWPREKALELSAQALQLLRCDQHEQHDEYREHCGACALRGYLSDSARADGQTEADGPNYCGWARVYVQAGRAVPLHWMQAFQGQLDSDNRLYAEALLRDVATWGVRFRL